MKKINITILSIVSLLLLVKITMAQSPSRTIALTPPTIEHSLNPGEEAGGIIKVINSTDEPLTFTATVQDFIVDDPSGIPTILPSGTLSDKYSAASWIIPSPSKFAVKPHERLEINYSLRAPETARPGGHYAVVIFKPEELIKVKGTGTAVNTQIGTLFYIDISGEITEKAEIIKFSANAFQEYGPVKISTQIKNFGDLHIKPIGNILITDMLGRKIATLKLDEQNIFPEAIRNYENTLEQKRLFGPFKAKLTTGYGRENNLLLEATLTFWILPWRTILVIILSLITVILGIMYWRKSKRKPKEDLIDQYPINQE